MTATDIEINKNVISFDKIFLLLSDHDQIIFLFQIIVWYYRVSNSFFLNPQNQNSRYVSSSETLPENWMKWQYKFLNCFSSLIQWFFWLFFGLFWDDSFFTNCKQKYGFEAYFMKFLWLTNSWVFKGSVENYFGSFINFKKNNEVYLIENSCSLKYFLGLPK